MEKSSLGAVIECVLLTSERTEYCDYDILHNFTGLSENDNLLFETEEILGCECAINHFNQINLYFLA